MKLTKQDLDCVITAIGDREFTKLSSRVRCVRLTSRAKQFLIAGKFLQETGTHYNTNITQSI